MSNKISTETSFRHCYGEKPQVYTLEGRFNEMPAMLREAAALLEENDGAWPHHISFVNYMDDPDSDLTLTVILS